MSFHAHTKPDERTMIYCQHVRVLCNHRPMGEVGGEPAEPDGRDTDADLRREFRFAQREVHICQRNS
jgi:hypothetical protein